MKNIDEERVLDLLQRGVKLALDNPCQDVTVELHSLGLYVKIVLDESDRRDEAFVGALPSMALSDIKRKMAGRQPRFINVYKYSRLVLRG